ncbi:hypothetical protein [Flavobacterium coralii]|uniref:hypothetical protein n=1 Tax=Flavobacterium coralii TaxID=2838017 RepID=UPI000C5294C7|nr:hypothetical protein [Flavobacterium sp.]|tara:strand:- start:10215 stop:10718 length:504 start_codon:yes stop_codon:yes gene_type:complete
MEFTGPYCYTLQLTGDKESRIIAGTFCNGIEAKYSGPIVKTRVPKIYILKQGNKLVYVGYTSQSITNRFRQGIKASGTKGYHGYKWKQAHELQLLVFVFDQKLVGNKHDDDIPFIALAEAVEAELVYIVRNTTGKWPAYQNEIHFNNQQSELAKAIADDIYQKIINT